MSRTDVQQGMTPREPNLFFTGKSFHNIRGRLVRLSHHLGNFPTVDALYDEILDIFVSNGEARRPRRERSSNALPWMSFVSDEEMEVFVIFKKIWM